MPNRLLERLGEGAVSALFDEFVWPDAGGEEGGGQAASDTTAATNGAGTAQLPALRNLLVHGRLQLDEVRPEAVALPTPEH